MNLRDTVAEVDLDAIASNVAYLRERAGVPVIAVVKADGYGHGAEASASACLEGGAEMLAVATVEEGEALRAAGIEAPILVMLGASSAGEARCGVDARLELAVWRADQLDALAEASAGGQRAPVHLKVDTGLTRLGVRPEEVPDTARAIRRRRSLELSGVYTHLATSDEADLAYTRAQLDSFRAVLRALDAPPRWQHALASAGILAIGSEGAFTAVRPGVAVYGLDPRAPRVVDRRLRPALRVRSRIARVRRVPAGTGVSYGREYVTDRERSIGTVPFGYGDGLPRRAWPGGGMLVRGTRVPIVGRVCMDLVMLDLSDAPEAREGDEVVIVGEQDGVSHSADDLAAELGTINYEVATNLHPRVPRVYRRGDRIVARKTLAGYARA